MDTIPLLPQSETARNHAIRLIREERTGGAIVLPDPSLFQSATHRMVVQRYREEVSYQDRFKELAARRRCGFRLIEGVTGLVGNYWIAAEDETPGAWAWDPGGQRVVEEVRTPQG